jgi:putative transposase
MAGLADKMSRPHHFANSIPVWLREQLVLLFIKFPQWTPYQYYKYIKGHPAYHWAISVPTIAKLKETHTIRTAEERARLKKLWAFAPGTAAWTVDYTCLYKTDRYKLQLLTVSDHRSRFLFETALFLETSTETLMDHLEELFVKYGKPFMVKADNGPEFRLDCRQDLEQLSVYLMNSPSYYAPFNGAHERIHRTLKEYIDSFAGHCNITRLEANIRSFRDDYNHRIPLESLGMKTPAEIFYSDPDFLPKDAEVVTPYMKDGELRMKFTDRNGDPARISIPQIDP